MESHGGPYDRGRADAYHFRKPDPHKYPLGTYNGERVVLSCPSEIAQYFAGYLDHFDMSNLPELPDLPDKNNSNELE